MDLSQYIFGPTSDWDRLEKLGDGLAGGKNLGHKKDACLYLLCLSLLANGLASLTDLEATPLELVSSIHKVNFCGCYLPSSMVEVLTSVKKYLRLARAYPGIPPVVDLKQVKIERYLYYWTSDKHKGLLTSEEKITFDSNSESWPVFCIEMTGILIKFGLQELLSSVLPGASSVLPPHLYFQSSWLGAVLNMAVNKSPLRWLMNEGEKDGVYLCLLLKIKYESAAKLVPLRI